MSQFYFSQTWQLCDCELGVVEVLPVAIWSSHCFASSLIFVLLKHQQTHGSQVVEGGLPSAPKLFVDKNLKHEVVDTPAADIPQNKVSQSDYTCSYLNNLAFCAVLRIQYIKGIKFGSLVVCISTAKLMCA